MYGRESNESGDVELARDGKNNNNAKRNGKSKSPSN